METPEVETPAETESHERAALFKTLRYGASILLALVLAWAIFYFPAVDCPRCHGAPIKYLCRSCKGDGRVSIWYSLGLAPAEHYK